MAADHVEGPWPRGMRALHAATIDVPVREI
jgi:hypothetical protein